MIELQKFMIKLKDTMAKTGGIVATQFYLIDGGLKAGQSTWRGPIGDTVRLVGKVVK